MDLKTVKIKEEDLLKFHNGELAYYDHPELGVVPIDSRIVYVGIYQDEQSST